MSEARLSALLAGSVSRITEAYAGESDSSPGDTSSIGSLNHVRLDERGSAPNDHMGVTVASADSVTRNLNAALEVTRLRSRVGAS